ncbi:uncharacterized protein LOC116307291 [Actinia tenebrosa]|uniref:Uncharacterized protein LOC116307291 n=1 Tax=Actinia tenebrosa TaxID=6105 RepID=A0A6P8J0G0_ACTTE|nr:uncharacterized protein LOC116307291 [Actinia tenebrosa]
MFGLKRSKNTEHDSQLVNINTYIQKVNYNSNMHPRYKNRVYFVGNLTMGHAWFTLRNVTLKDTREYFAVIRDGTGVGKYTVRLEVKTKSEVTKESDRIPITEKRQNVTQGLQPENKTINETGTPLILAGKTNSTQQLRGDYIIAFTIISYLILCVAHIDTYISVH